MEMVWECLFPTMLTLVNCLSIEFYHFGWPELIFWVSFNLLHPLRGIIWASFYIFKNFFSPFVFILGSFCYQVVDLPGIYAWDFLDILAPCMWLDLWIFFQLFGPNIYLWQFHIQILFELRKIYVISFFTDLWIFTYS